MLSYRSPKYAILVLIVAATIARFVSMSSKGTKAKHIVIVGSGLAGSVAAVAAARQDHHTRITLLEREPTRGGNSMKASSGINAVCTQNNDSIDTFLQDTLASGGHRCNQALVSTLVTESRDALHFLESLGADLSSTVQLGGHSTERTHFPPRGPNVGTELMRAVTKALDALPNVEVITSARVVDVSMDEKHHRINGVCYHKVSDDSPLEKIRYETIGRTFLPADAVILATGGYSANSQLLAQHAQHAKDLATTNGPFAQGDGLVLGASVGASLVDLDQVQIHPTGFVDPGQPQSTTKFLAPEKLRGNGGILLNSQGRRFVNELDTRDKVSHAILQQGGTAYLLLGSDSATQFGPAIQFYAGRGLFARLETLQQAADHIHVHADTLRHEIDSYNDAAQGQHLDQFGKTIFPSIIDPEGPLYIASIVPVIHYTMGGLRIDEHGRVLRNDDDDATAIHGLYAVGEVSGGIHGGNRLGGNSLLECTVFGLRAGRHAAGLAAVP